MRIAWTLVHDAHLVLATDSGFRAGSWGGGVLAEPLTDDVAQRNSLIAAFDVAARAASAESKSFSRKANARASQFYAKQARLLRAQMD